MSRFYRRRICVAIYLVLVPVVSTFAQGKQRPSKQPPSVTKSKTVGMVRLTGPGSQSALTAPAEFASWVLGKDLAFICRQHIGGKEADMTKVRIFAKGLQIELPPLPEKMRLVDLRNYISEDATKSVAALISKQHSERCGALCQLPTELMIAAMMYAQVGGNDALESQAALNKQISGNLKIVSVNAKLHTFPPLREVVQWIDDNKNSGPVFSKKLQETMAAIHKQVADEFGSTSGATSSVTSAVDVSENAAERYVAWTVGKDLSIAMNLKVRGGDDDLDHTFQQVNGLAKTIGVDLPAMPPLKGIGDVWKAREYLHGEKDSVQAAFDKRYTGDVGALVQLSSGLVFSSILYHSEDGIGDQQKGANRICADTLSEALKTSYLQDFEPINEVVKWIVDGKPSTEAFVAQRIDTLKKLDAKLKAEFLQSQKLPARNPGLQPPEDSPTKPEADPALVTTFTAMDREAEATAQKYVSRDRTARPKFPTIELKPTLQACEKLLDAKVASSVFNGYSQIFNGDVQIQADSDYTEVRLRKFTTDEMLAGSSKRRNFPGGYRQVIPHFKPGHTVYEVNYVEPGETKGMRYDGLVKIDGKWYLFPKLWRVIGDTKDVAKPPLESPVEK